MKRLVDIMIFCLILAGFGSLNSPYLKGAVVSQKRDLKVDNQLYKIASQKGAKKALKEYKRLRKEKPQSYIKYQFDNILNRIGIRLLNAGKGHDALEFFKLNNKLYPEQWNPWDSLGFTYEKAGDYKHAKINYYKALELNPGNNDSLGGMHRIFADYLDDLIKKEGIETAIKKYQKLKYDKSEKYDFSIYRYNNHLNILGYRLAGLGKMSEAIEIFKLNVQSFPKAVNAIDSLAEGYLRKGDYQNSKKHYQQALRVNPDYAASATGLRRIYIIENYTKKEYRIPMRDSKKLFTQVYTPKDDSKKYPFMLFRTPYRVFPYGEDKLAYRNQLGPSEFFAREGYIFVRQDVRGRFMSDDEYVDMRPIITSRKGPQDIDESTDTYDTIEWLLHNVSGNNGKVGMFGTSYPGVYSAMALVQGHPALAAVSPQAPPMDWFMGDDFHRNGAFYYLQAVNFFRGTGVLHEGLIKAWPQRALQYPTNDLYQFLLNVGPVSNINSKFFKGKLPMWNQMMKHGNYDKFWQSRDVAPHLKNVKAAVMTVGGWFDAEDLYGPLKCYQSIENKNPGINNTLVMGPWYHGGWDNSPSEYLGDIRVNAKSAMTYYKKEIELPFFNYYLKGEGDFNSPEALIFNTGTRQWNKYTQWPPQNVVNNNLYFQPGKKLDFTKPKSNSKNNYVQYLSDPANPVPHNGNPIRRWSYDYMHTDQRYAEKRADVLTYKTEILKKDVTLSGPIYAELYIDTTGTDADFFVKVIDVFPGNTKEKSPNEEVKMGGYQMLIRGEAMRSKFRNSFEKPEPLIPGKVEKVRFELQDIHHTFKKGHRIMVQVQSTWFPLFDRNPQKFTDIYSAKPEDFQKATHKIYHSKKYPSRIEFRTLR